MRIILEDCSTITLALVFNYMVWGVPALLVALAVIVIYIASVVIVIRRRREWDLTHDPLVGEQNKKRTKEVASVIFLVLGFVFVNSLDLILRIIQLFGGKAFPLWVIIAICIPLIPGLFALIMTVDSDTCNTALRSFRRRDWLDCFKINWDKVLEIEDIPSLEQVLENHKEVFSEVLGLLKGVEVKLALIPEAPPKFFNPALKLDRYPIPKVEDVLATLAGGKSFTKLDLNQAYTQLALDKESKELTGINAHKGLLRYTRLPFGVSSAPGIFQRIMETLLLGIPNVVVYLDDILITGHTNQEHLDHLHEDLQRGIPSQVSARIQRWALTMAAYEYDKKTSQHGNADGLIRLPLTEPDEEQSEVPTEVVLLVEALEDAPMTYAQIQRWTKRYRLLCKVSQFILHGWQEERNKWDEEMKS
ncbi:hypothetical protein EMCRGX_G023352 [Ephydatia muelleri]